MKSKQTALAAMVAIALVAGSFAAPSYAAPPTQPNAHAAENRAWGEYWLAFLDTLDRKFWAQNS